MYEAKKFHKNKTINKQLGLKSLLNDLDIVSFNSLIIDFFAQIKFKSNSENMLIGSSVSGIFLAHLYNLFTKKTNNVYSHIAYPYVAIHPYIDRFTVERGNKINFILLDESIKTGFNSKIVENLLLRLIHPNDMKNVTMQSNSIFKNHIYSNDDTSSTSMKHLLHFFLVDDDNYTVMRPVETDKDNQGQKEDTKKILIDKILDIEPLREIFSYKNFFYFHRTFFYNSKLFWVGTNFLASQIKKDISKKSDPIFIYSPRVFDKIIAFAVTWILKNSGYTKMCFGGAILKHKKEFEQRTGSDFDEYYKKKLIVGIKEDEDLIERYYKDNGKTFETTEFDYKYYIF